MKDLINKIKSMKYSNLTDEIIEQEITSYLRKKPKAKDKEIIKQVKSKLHKIYGSYQINKKKKRDALLIELESNKDNIELHKKILETNLATKERIFSYPKVYEKIFSITGYPNSILDLGCGINPISYPFMKTKVKYLAVDIDESDVNFVNEYFKIKNINGKALTMAVNENNIKNFPKVDICLIFKFVDLLGKKGNKLTELLINKIKAKYLVVSFSTKTISNKKMNYPRRGWFEQMMKRLGYHYILIKTNNEFYYVIQK